MEFNAWTSPNNHPRVVASLSVIGPAIGVAVRRRWLLQFLPVAAAGELAVALLYGSRIGGAGLAGGIAGLLVSYGAGAFVPGRRTWLALAMGLFIFTVNAVSAGTLVVANLFFDDIVVGLLPWMFGRVSRERAARAVASRRQAEALDATRELHVQAAALGERARLAREIHDVIAHSVSVMVIQSAAARTVMAGDPERAEGSLRVVERAGREALAEMRRLLGVLGDGSDPRRLAPQPGLGDLHELVSRTAQAGLSTSIQIDGEPRSVPAGVSLCAYRVVQEALTNAIKHAGPARARVSVRWGQDALELEVHDDGRGPAVPTNTDSGHGIRGMRERAALHGGSVEAGPAPGGGFAVRARLPLTVAGAVAGAA
jgi:signal transduction histidine kinase